MQNETVAGSAQIGKTCTADRKATETEIITRDMEAVTERLQNTAYRLNSLLDRLRPQPPVNEADKLKQSEPAGLIEKLRYRHDENMTQCSSLECLVTELENYI